MNRGRIRLSHLREQAEAVEAEMVGQRERFKKLAGEDSKPRTVSAFNLFQTPEHIAARMVEALPEIPSGGAILEPSAGLGRLYRAIRGRFASNPVALIERSPDCAAELYRETEGDELATLKVRDFLKAVPSPQFAAVVMNPPFKQGRDIKHILHAARMLEPGGVLVALCYDGVRQAAKLRPRAHTWEPLAPGSFKSEGTNAGAVMLTIRR